MFSLNLTRNVKWCWVPYYDISYSISWNAGNGLQMQPKHRSQNILRCKEKDGVDHTSWLMARKEENTILNKCTLFPCNLLIPSHQVCHWSLVHNNSAEIYSLLPSTYTSSREHVFLWWDFDLLNPYSSQVSITGSGTDPIFCSVNVYSWETKWIWHVSHSIKIQMHTAEVIPFSTPWFQ